MMLKEDNLQLFVLQKIRMIFIQKKEILKIVPNLTLAVMDAKKRLENKEIG